MTGICRLPQNQIKSRTHAADEQVVRRGIGKDSIACQRWAELADAIARDAPIERVVCIRSPTTE